MIRLPIRQPLPRETTHHFEKAFRELVQPLFLFLDQELGVTNNVDEQDMPDLKVKIIVGLRRHQLCVAERRQAAYLF